MSPRSPESDSTSTDTSPRSKAKKWEEWRSAQKRARKALVTSRKRPATTMPFVTVDKKQEEGSKLSEPRVEEKLNYEVGISCIFQGQNSYA